MLQQPKYQSFFIINNRRQYQKTTISKSSLDKTYQQARQRSVQLKRLPVSSRCHRILSESRDGSRQKENLISQLQVRSYFTGKRICEQQYSKERLSFSNATNNLHNIDQLSMNYYQMPVTTVDKYKYLPKPRESNEFWNLAESLNTQKIQFINKSVQLNPLSQSVSSSQKSNSTSNNRVKISKLKLYKQQLQSSREHQQVVSTQIIVKRQSSTQQEIKSFQLIQKKDLNKSQYHKDQHLPHKLIFSTIKKKQDTILDEKDQEPFISVKDKVNKSAKKSISKEVNSKSMIFNKQLETIKDQRQKTNDHSYFTTNSAQNIGTHQVSNIFTHQSQLIVPTSPSRQLYSSPPQSSFKTLPHKNIITHLLSPPQRQKTGPSSFKKVTEINLKPSESFILQPTAQQIETIDKIKQNKPKTLDSYYEQELRRREETNQILRSLISMKIVNQRGDV